MSPLLFVALAALAPSASPSGAGTAPRPTILERYLDRSEAAFVVLVPAGWTVQGGIGRVNPLTMGGWGAGPAAVEAKLDLAVTRDAGGTASVRWIPKTLVSGLPTPAMPVAPCPQSARDYLLRVLMPRLRPAARNVSVVEERPMTELVTALRKIQQVRSMQTGMVFLADAAFLTVAYDEGGQRYREMLFSTLEAVGARGPELWSNPLTVTGRAPEVEFQGLRPVLELVARSFQLDPRWLAGELQGQATRAATVLDTQRAIQDIDAQIVSHRQQTNATVANDQYLTITGQEEYVNPFTSQVEIGSNSWGRRWQNGSGSVIYTDDPAYDPNADPTLRIQGYRLTPPRPR